MIILFNYKSLCIIPYYRKLSCYKFSWCYDDTNRVFKLGLWKHLNIKLVYILLIDKSWMFHWKMIANPINLHNSNTKQLNVLKSISFTWIKHESVIRKDSFGVPQESSQSAQKTSPDHTEGFNQEGFIWMDIKRILLINEVDSAWKRIQFKLGSCALFQREVCVESFSRAFPRSVFICFRYVSVSFDNEPFFYCRELFVGFFSILRLFVTSESPRIRVIFSRGSLSLHKGVFEKSIRIKNIRLLLMFEMMYFLRDSQCGFVKWFCLKIVSVFNKIM